jgi:hypothetical protein
MSKSLIQRKQILGMGTNYQLDSYKIIKFKWQGYVSDYKVSA